MATGKKKVIVYTDWEEVFESLSDEEAGRLIKHFFAYINDKNPQSDRLTELLFKPIKNTLKRDLEAWEKKAGVSRGNGSKGGRPKKTQDNPAGFSETQDNPKKPVSVSVSVTDSDSASTNVEKFHPAEIAEIVNRLFGKDLTERKVPRFDLDIINDLITVYGYTKQEIIQSWENLSKDQWHKERPHVITLSYLSQTKTMERFGKSNPAGQNQNTQIFKRSNLNLDDD